MILAVEPGAVADGVTQVLVQWPAELRASDVARGDIDGDGQGDLVIAVIEDEGDQGESGDALGARQRSLRIHLRVPAAAAAGGAPALSSEPSRVLPLPADAVAFAVGDVLAAPGDEIVLFSASGAYACAVGSAGATGAQSAPGATGAPGASGDARFVELARSPFLWQVPERDGVFAWPEALVDLDADGRLDLCLPEPDGYCFFARPAAPGETHFEPRGRLMLPRDEDGLRMRGGRGSGRGGGRRMSFSLDLDVSREGFGGLLDDLLDIDDRTPVLALADWDGDRDLDALALSGWQIDVFAQGPGAVFAGSPSKSLPLPIERSRERAFDLVFTCLIGELDGDGRADCVISASDERSDDVRTQILVFEQAAAAGEPPLFGAKGVPRSLLVVDGFAGALELIDVDGDGKRDIVARALEPGLLSALASGSDPQGELLVFLNRGGAFTRTADLSWRAPIRETGIGARFAGDADGDGLCDLLVRRDDALELLRVARARTGLAVESRPLARLPCGEETELVPLTPHGAKRTELVLLDEHELRWVELGR